MSALRLSLCCAGIVAGLAATPDRSARADDANDFSRLKVFGEMRANRRENEALKVSEEDLGAHTQNVVQGSFNGRDMILYVPSRLPTPARAIKPYLRSTASKMLMSPGRRQGQQRGEQYRFQVREQLKIDV